MNRAQRLSIASVVTGGVAVSGPWIHAALARVLPFYKNPVDLTWTGFAFLAVLSALALASVGLGVEARRLLERGSTWSSVGGTGVLLGVLAEGLYVLLWFGAMFVESLPWQHPF